MYQAGGTLLAIWLGFCSLGGIALSVLVPIFVERRFKLRERLRTAVAKAA
jgi:sensor c-di-GMP phosphodiesterase-like protein